MSYKSTRSSLEAVMQQRAARGHALLSQARLRVRTLSKPPFKISILSIKLLDLATDDALYHCYA
jgi:hypothetical protein